MRTDSVDQFETSLKMSCKLVQPFSRNLANKETKKQRNKEIDQKQYPVPRSIGDGVLKDHPNQTATSVLCKSKISLSDYPQLSLAERNVANVS